MATIPIYTKEARDSIAASVRDNKIRKSKQPDPIPKPTGVSGILVQVLGPPVAIVTTTTPTTSSTSTSTSSTGTTTSTTPCLGNSTTGIPTATTAAAKYLYPGRFVYRNIDSLDNQEYFYPGEDVWIEEVNQRPLGLNCKYPGHISSQYRGQLVVAVRNDLTPALAAQSCTGNGTTTSCACIGYCEWVLTSEGWIREFTSCDEVGGCDCPQPDFCPPDGGCAETYTLCGHGSDPNAVLVNCQTTTTTSTTTGTGTTSTTATTTTTTPDPTDCGAGCVWKNIPGIGIILVSADCNAGLVLSGGYTCLSCPQPSVVVPECDTVVTPCGVLGPPPPPPGCSGGCLWVWPDVVGMWWILRGSSCSTGLGVPCYCDIPSVAGSVCNQQVVTPCHEPGPTTGTGTTTSGTGTTSATSLTTTTTLGGCLDYCFWRCNWKVDPHAWVIIRDCGSNCGCSEPLLDCTDPCDIVKTPCRPTTTTTPTTSTTATTTTTSCPTNCEWTCTQDSFSYFWQLTSVCGGDCECQPVDPSTICGPSRTDSDGAFGAGAVIISPCFPATTTSSTTSTTTTTTADPCETNPCTGFTPPCFAYCYEATGLPGFYSWIPCPGQMNCGSPCDWSSTVCGPCNASTICSVCLGFCPDPTTTSATGTTQTGTDTTASFTTAFERPTTSTQPEIVPGDFDPQLWFHYDWVYEDLGGTDSALIQDEDILLGIHPGDDPTSPVEHYVLWDSIAEPPQVHFEMDGTKWVDTRDSVYLNIDSTIVVDTATKSLTIIAVVDRPASGTINLIAAGTGGSLASIGSDNNIHLATDSSAVSQAYTGSTGRILVVLEVDSGAVYVQTTGMARTLVSSISGTFNFESILGDPTTAVWTSNLNYHREILIYDKILDSTDKDALCNAGGYFDLTSGVSL